MKSGSVSKLREHTHTHTDLISIWKSFNMGDGMTDMSFIIRHTNV